MDCTFACSRVGKLVAEALRYAWCYRWRRRSNLKLTRPPKRVTHVTMRGLLAHRGSTYHAAWQNIPELRKLDRGAPHAWLRTPKMSRRECRYDHLDRRLPSSRLDCWEGVSLAIKRHDISIEVGTGETSSSTCSFC